MKTILVTGGGGYIGSALVEQLMREHYRVKVFDRFFFGKNLVDALPSKSELTLIRGDIRHIDPEVFEGVSAVMHLAALSNDPSCDLDPKLTEEINLHGTLRTARTAKEAGVPHFILSSSCSIYGAGDGTEILTEESPPRPVSLYARCKLQAEEEVFALADANFYVTSLRNATVYGMSRRMRFDLIVNLMTLYAFKNHRIIIMGGGKQWRPLVHVRDLARAFVEVMEAERATVDGEIFNVGTNEQNYQVEAVARMVADALPNTEIEWRADDPDRRSYHVDFRKIATALDYTATFSVPDGIQEIYDALRRGYVDDDIRTRTVGFYRYLIEAEQLVNDLALDGNIF